MMETAALSETKRRLFEALSRGESAAVRSDIARRPNSDGAPLGASQEEVCRRSIWAADAPSPYNESITVYREGALDVAILERCFAEILRRHEAWRTSFRMEDGNLVQAIAAPPQNASIPVVDLRDLAPELRTEEFERQCSDRAQQPFDLERGPLIRTSLFRFGDASYRIAIVAHQSVIDGVSMYQVLPSELSSLYEAFSAGKASPLPELPLQYADFCAWQRRWLGDGNREKQIGFWKTKLDQLSTERDRQIRETYRGKIRSFEVPATCTAAIRDLVRRERVTLFTALLAGFAALRSHVTEMSDILVATLSPSGRKRLETQKLLGYFLNPVALRFEFAADTTFKDLLHQARTLIGEAISNDDVPLEQVGKALNIDSGRDPFVKVAISLQPRVPSLPGWDVTSMDAQNGGSVWDLYLAFIERGDALAGRAQFNPDIFTDGAIQSALHHLWRLLANAATDPAASVRELLER
jgi:hypothetical protein